MYLSRLLLNPRNPAVRRDLHCPYDLHRTLMRSLTGERSPERLLFRVEDLQPPTVLVQHTVPPDWSALLQNGYLRTVEGPKAFQPALLAGQYLRFRLLANPVKKRQGQRIPLRHRVRQHEQDTTYFDWLDRQACDHGFAVVQVDGVPLAPDIPPEPLTGKAAIPHFGVRFDGVLRVTDAARLVEAVRSGIGPAKAFGFGLLSLRRM
jgi:CRISPR system Cascade subunit CasE